MSGCNKTITRGPLPLHTDGTEFYLFFPFSEPFSTKGLGKARSSVELSQCTPNIKGRAAIRVSNDGNNWDSPVSLGSEQTGNGTTYGDTYVDIGATMEDKALGQVGIQVLNTSGSLYELAMGSLKVDLV